MSNASTAVNLASCVRSTSRSRARRLWTELGVNTYLSGDVLEPSIGSHGHRSTTPDVLHPVLRPVVGIVRQHRFNSFNHLPLPTRALLVGPLAIIPCTAHPATRVAHNELRSHYDFQPNNESDNNSRRHRNLQVKGAREAVHVNTMSWSVSVFVVILISRNLTTR